MKNKNELSLDPTSLSNTIAPTAPGLWSRILPWHQRLAADRPFMNRVRTALAADEAEATAAVLEYLRFAYLAWISPDGATPSKAVDEVWHAHLLFTRSYDAFCRGTRGEHLHHEPGDGGSDEKRYRLAYLRTLERYEIEFGAPNARWWPRTATPVPSPPSADRSIGARIASALAIALAGLVLAALAGEALADRAVGVPAALMVCAATVVAAAFSLLDKPPPSPAPARGSKGGKSDGNYGSGAGGFVPTIAGDPCPDGSCGSGCGGGGCGGA
jgi:hypothetical protein